MPVNSSVLGHDAAMCEPQIKQMFICGKDDIGIDVKRYEEHLQSRLYVVGKKIERRIMESIDNLCNDIQSLQAWNL